MYCKDTNLIPVAPQAPKERTVRVTRSTSAWGLNIIFANEMVRVYYSVKHLSKIVFLAKLND